MSSQVRYSRVGVIVFSGLALHDCEYNVPIFYLNFFENDDVVIPCF